MCFFFIEVSFWESPRFTSLADDENFSKGIDDNAAGAVCEFHRFLSVTAPSDAELTSLAYLARTPLV